MQNSEHVRELCVACVQTVTQSNVDEEAHAQFARTFNCVLMARSCCFLFEVKTLRNHGVAVERLRERVQLQVTVTRCADKIFLHKLHPRKNQELFFIHSIKVLVHTKIGVER